MGISALPDPIDGYRRCFIALGSNLGDRLGNLALAAQELTKVEGVKDVRLSPVYETAPWGRTDQPWYLNAVAESTCRLGPFELLDRVKEIEKRLGRIPGTRWGPRLVDLDILLLGDLWLRCGRLNIPHIDLQRRRFVLTPLADLDPGLVLPDGVVITELLAKLPTEPAVRPFGRLDGHPPTD